MNKLSFDQLSNVVSVHPPGTNVCTQFKQLFLRNAVGLSRNPAALLGRIVISIFVSLVSLTLFWNAGGKLEDETDPFQV